MNLISLNHELCIILFYICHDIVLSLCLQIVTTCSVCAIMYIHILCMYMYYVQQPVEENWILSGM